MKIFILSLMFTACLPALEIVDAINKDKRLWIRNEGQFFCLTDDHKYIFTTGPKDNGLVGSISQGEWKESGNFLDLVGDWGFANAVGIVIKKKFTVHISHLQGISGRPNEYNAWVYFDEIVTIK